MNNQENLFDPIKNRRIFEKVSSRIKELVFEGVLKVGDRLPSEAELAQQFSVGRQTIREALRLLEGSGFISIQRGGTAGPIIKDTILIKIKDLFYDAFRMRKVSLEELTLARLEIEKIVMGYVIDNIDENEIKELRKNVTAAKKKIEGNVIATEENILFHKLLAKATKNHVFVIVVESMMAVVGDSLSRIGPDIETSSNVVQFHEEILKAIAEKKRDKAIILLERHLLEVKGRLQPLEAQQDMSR